jgi:hypothetical protein
MSVFLVLGAAARAGCGVVIAAIIPAPRLQPHPRRCRRLSMCVIAFPLAIPDAISARAG